MSILPNDSSFPSARRPGTPTRWLAAGTAVAAFALLAGCSSPPAKAPAAKSRPAPAASHDDPGADVDASRSASSKKPIASSKQPAPPGGGSARAPAPSAPRAAPPPSAAERNFSRPAGGPVIARFDGRGNKGVDFGGAKGDPVRAARDGRVAYAAAGPRGYGQLVMIKHDATYVSAYAHNSQILVKEGQSVKRGQVIARMGSSEADRVKLHFELRRNGNAVDPMGYIASGDAGGTP